MKEIKCTRGKVALVDDDIYPFLMRWNWQADKKGYATRFSNILPKAKKIMMHKLILTIFYGHFPDGYVTDHIDGNKMNNQISNLRLATHGQNRMNIGKIGNPRMKTCKYKGVVKDGNRYCVRINSNGVQYKIGKFNSEIDAALAYNEAAIKYHG